jgi:hypothetical protein
MNTRPFHRITSPTDLLALVPSALGFHPEDSLVLVVTAGEMGNLHARIDLPGDDEETLEVVRTLTSAVTRAEASQVALVAYSDDELLAEDVVDLLLGQPELREVDVICAVRADGRCWYALDCGPTWAPPEGVAYDVSAHPITAQSVLDGRVTFGSRRDLADSLVGTDLDALDAVGDAADEAVRRFKASVRQPLGTDSPEGARAHLMAEGYWVRERVRRFVQTREPLDHQEAGRMAVALVNIDVRDVAWAEMSRSNARTHVELWLDLVRRTPLDLVAAPAALLAFAAWLAGDGALAWCAVERCQEAEPGYSMAGLVSQTLASAVHPSVWQPIPPEELPLFAG